jgi:hypothetical protein
MIKEFLIGKLLALYPFLIMDEKLYKKPNTPADERKWLIDLGINDWGYEGNPNVVNFEKTQDNFRKNCIIMFSLMLKSAYIGKLFQYLVFLVRNEFHEFSCIALYTLIILAGDQLKAKYKKAYLEVIKYIQEIYLPKFKLYYE